MLLHQRHGCVQRTGLVTDARQKDVGVTVLNQ